ncbi:MAG: SPFH domain-containing protein [Ktedonobacteraceae bacterium]|nr:SPFH domain-containing protein [Ktedonobacteraceae bacterium]MBO0795787.1 SPFH domain-containing protein [Ktedonobacteraceae bacterium]
MALLSYFKAEPTEYILAYRNGQVFQRGSGRTFWYWAPSASIVLIPISTVDTPFVFNETTSDFQAITLQGQITYRISQPETIAALLNFTIHPRTRKYQSEDPAKLDQRIVNVIQMRTRGELRQMDLETALRSSEPLARTVLEQLRQEEPLQALGIECLSLFFTSIRATPEITKALEADYREALQKRADQAIYSRRADAVEQERKIKQNELATEILLEQNRQELIHLEGENERRKAELAAEALRLQLAPYREVDPRLLLALSMRDFANNSKKIGNLTITSEILEQLFNGRS